MQIEKLLKQPNALPSAPKVVRQLIDTFDQEEVDMVRVAALIQEDPVLTAKLLKMANSAFFGLTRSVTNAREALNVMGLMKVRALVIAASLGEGFHCVGGVNLNQFWRYSLNTANLARYLALPIRIDENTAFTAGLIHCVGELVMHVGMPEAMLDLDRSVPMLDLKRARAEKGLFGYHYADVGAALAREWRFPKRMIQAIEHQVAPFDNDIYEPIAGVIHIASWRARAQELDLRNELLINTYPDPVGLVLGIDPDTVIGEEIPALTREHAAESESA
ncbi:MAG TPA: HDOD domain-containing protein [Hydrogenophaga sp.]|uniref:HDOD domain-containing protein n=1 Tax=Hydrogenophaga sp. TaxID=1904254 RepID=UPI002BE4E19A|nr:HDOD domain-containing protein [Hydrogenophaga sp.]HMN91765.1 HDOD domain-containing protein [Hydrogenophaga sp.]HMP10086.1 HDOD domain-containing protein [Hydrogenophaga sp.]